MARGRWGEDLAARWYLDAGYTILDRNWRCRNGEIDIVAACATTLVIVEVKARRSGEYGHPSLAVGRAKQQRLRRLAVEWLHTTGASAETVRFDVVAITGGTIQVIEGAF